jgi:hypothetical protein
MSRAIFLDSFSGAAADLKKGQRNEANVLAALAKSPRVSTWDMEAARLRSCLKRLTLDGLIVEDKAAMVASLVAERDALVEDAERYRWLRDKCGDSFLGVFKHAWDSHHRTWLSGATLDAAIDAARLSAKEPT